MKHIQHPDWRKIEEVLRKGQICHVAFTENEEPYVLPLNYGYSEGALYIHSSAAGKKIDLLTQNPKVSFNVLTEVQLKQGKSACNFSMYYYSVIGGGNIFLLEDSDEKRFAVDQIVLQCGAEPFAYPQSQIDKMKVLKIDIETISYKERTPQD